MMSERDYAPLSAACVRSLNDKLYEKRKAAALEIEKMVKEFAAHNNTVQIKRLLKVLGQDLATSQNPHTRKGGLIGLAAIAVGLGKDTGQYIEDLIHPILACFCDSDLNVRYYACESLYNVVKVARGAVLPQFTDIFAALSKLACDSEQHVKNATELLDRLMKDIVTESGLFDLVGFMPLLRERICTKNPFGRQFVIAWVSVLDAVPNMDFIIFLPEILDGLFKILEDPTPEIKKVTDTVLGEFLRSIKTNPSRVDFPGMINILITHAQSTDELLQLTAITWIKEFVHLSGPLMLPYMSGILIAVLPCLAYDGDTRKCIKQTATQVNANLMKLITMKNVQVLNNASESGGQPVQGKLHFLRYFIYITTYLFYNLSPFLDASQNDSLAETLDLPSVVEVLTKHLMYISVQTKVAVLKWIHHLFIHIPHKMFYHIDNLFPILMKSLSDNSDEVVQQTLVVMAEIISSKSPEAATMDSNAEMQNRYFTKFIVNLLRLFSTDRNLLVERGAFIIRELCVLLSAEDIYKTLAKILLDEQNLSFACTMIQTLNVILLTSSELFDLRNKLKDLDSIESCELFKCLYVSWCHNPVATVALCLLSQHYGHACNIIRSFENIEVTVEFLIEIDKLVQLIESPIFTYLRLQLLEREKNDALVYALYGLLMILPQSEAYATLQKRLAAIPPKTNVIPATPPSSKPSETMFDFPELLKHFHIVQERHKEQKRKQRLTNLIEKNTNHNDM
ncbi:protein VAC14 homolog isoform X1 [Megalopta genalis]|uniref:protein VAC14 homolog isoform X1 n=1 Tax=Megalopta genalis TaxID=115081 RepID=UPI0014431CD2|nr:protein VAC14 homolog isoform X1 [Megalopta genalis]XP_033328725.1 protein VAC14 homolog isoform X1 [Megalopta genalis]